MKPIHTFFAAGLMGLVAIAGSVRADDGDLEQVDGKLWRQQPTVVKQAYIVGISNLVDAEYAYQMKFAKPKPTSRQTLVQRLYEAGDGQTVDSIVKAVDGWYAANPDKLGKAVLDVLWLTFVKKD